MPRHVHKPQSTKNTKAILQAMHEARDATKDIKSELIEHNSVIKLHADASELGKANDQFDEQKKEESYAQPVLKSLEKAESSAASSAYLPKEAKNSKPFLQKAVTQGNSEASDKNASSSKDNNEEASRYVSNIIYGSWDQLIEAQLQFYRQYQKNWMALWNVFGNITNDQNTL